MSFVKLKEKQKPARFMSTLKRTVTGNSLTFYNIPYSLNLHGSKKLFTKILDTSMY